MAAMSSRRAGRMSADCTDGSGSRRRLVAIEDLLGGELRVAVLEKDGEQRMVKRQAHVHALHAVLEPAVAHAVEQLRASEMAMRGRGGAEVEDLPRPRAHRQRLDLHESDDAFLRVLGDKHLLRDVGDRHQRRQRLGQRLPEAQQRRLRDRDCRGSSAPHGARPRWPRGTAARCARGRGTMRSG